MSSTVSKNIFWLSISRVVALVLLFAAYTQLFRYLGPDGYGQYQFVLSYVLLFSTVVDFGIQQFITKRMSEDPDNTKKYFQNFFAFEFFLALLLYGTLIAIAYFRGYDPVVFKAVAITGLGMVANAMCYPFLAVMTAAQDLKKVAFINFLNSLVNITVIALAISLHKHIVFLASIQLIFGLVDLVLYRAFVRKHIPEPQAFRALGSLDFGLIKHILASAWPFALLVGFSAVYNRIDVLIITRLLGYEQTGLYGAAYKVFDLLGFFPSVVSHTLFPFLAGLMAKQLIGDVKVTLEKYERLMVAAALPLAVGGTVLAKPLIQLVAGPEYAPAAPVFAILVWATAILFVYIPVNSLVISQLTKLAVLITGINVVINIAGNIVLLPHIGIRGAAIMTVISESLQGIFYFYFVYKNITAFRFFSTLVKPAIAAGAMGLALWFIRDSSLVLTLPLGAAVYGSILLAAGFVTKDDIVFVRNFFKSSNPV